MAVLRVVMLVAAGLLAVLDQDDGLNQVAVLLVAAGLDQMAVLLVPLAVR